ncbi:hypothetical protein VB714_10685 [Spirulina sp. 06S082]|nr:hypothetical protein [Spirulina sp. 06S082]
MLFNERRSHSLRTRSLLLKRGVERRRRGISIPEILQIFCIAQIVVLD